MSQRSLLDFGVSHAIKRKIDNVASVNVEFVRSPSKVLKPDPKSKSRVFQKTWLTQFDWLEHNSNSNRMFCKVCRAAGVQNSFTKEGAGMVY